MKKSELPYLNLDKATSLYLPLEPIEARADHRFAFRLPNGDEEWLLARLCIEHSPDSYDKSLYVVVLRPEMAEKSRIFIVENFEYSSGRRKLNQWMRGKTAKKFQWDLFVQLLNDEKKKISLFRLCLIDDVEKTTLLKLHSGDGGVAGFASETEISSLQYYDAIFKWRRIPYEEEHRVTYLRFLRLRDASFKRKLRSLAKNANSDLHYVLRWVTLSDAERDAIAFECRKGQWSELREIAKLVLQLRVSELKKITQSNFTWDFQDWGEISIYGIRDLDDDDVLFLWRLALTHAFQTPNFDIDGVKYELLPHTLKMYIVCSEQSKVPASAPSMHEILEATLKLEAWVKVHFSLEHSQILMDSLKRFSEVDAQKLYDSLTESNSQ